MKSAYPAPIDVFVPVRNEAKFLRALLQQICSQDYFGLGTCWVAVAPSIDGTLAIANSFADENSRVRVVLNPQGTAASGLNACLSQSTAPYFVRLDGHLSISEAFLSNLATTYSTVTASCVGPRVKALGTGAISWAIANAMNSSIGVGNARFRTGSSSGFVDTVAFGIYRRADVDLVGSFNEALLRNQDDEFNSRFVRAGFKIWLDTGCELNYLVTRGFQGLTIQYFQYGWFRALAFARHDGSLGLRQLVPTAFVAGVPAAGIASLYSHMPILGGYFATYFLGLILLLFRDFAKMHKPRFLTLAAAAIMHTSYGIGVLAGGVALMKSPAARL